MNEVARTDAEMVYRDKAPLRALRMLMALGMAVCAIFFAAALLDPKSASHPGGLSLMAQILWIAVAGALMSLAAWVFRGAGRTSLVIGMRSIEVRNCLRTTVIPTSDVAGFVRRGAMSVALERMSGSRVPVTAISRSHGIDRFVNELNDMIRAKRAVASVCAPNFFRDNKRLELLRGCMGIAAFAGVLLSVIAAVGQSNAHNPDGLSPEMRILGFVLGIMILIVTVATFRAASRTYVLVSPETVEVHNGTRKIVIPASEVEGFGRGRPSGRGMTGAAVYCIDGRRIPISAIGRFKKERLEQITHQLSAAMGRVESGAAQGSREDSPPVES